MAKDTRLYVQTCKLCQRTKPSNQPPAGLLQPLPIPDRPWQTVSELHSDNRHMTTATNFQILLAPPNNQVTLAD
jgi:hypothetical protein